MKVDIKAFIQELFTISNAYGTAGYLKKWHKDAILDDPSQPRNFAYKLGSNEDIIFWYGFWVRMKFKRFKNHNHRAVLLHRVKSGRQLFIFGTV